MVAVYRRYLAFDPSVTEHYSSLLLAPEESERRRPLEAAKLCLSLARKAARGEYTSPEGKSPYQLLMDWLDIVENQAEEVGLDIEETEASNAVLKDKAGALNGNAFPNGPASPPYDEDEDPSSPRKLNIEHIVLRDGLNVYKDQAGRLWTGLATYWIKRAEFDRAKATFESGMVDVLAIRDFTQIFDAYAEFSESIISAYMETLANPEEEEDEEETAETEQELDAKMKEFEELMDRRPFLMNDVLIRRNPNDVQEWEKRVAMWGGDDEKVCLNSLTPLSSV
jgi:pre-mRNA-splicing factor SYF1